MGFPVVGNTAGLVCELIEARGEEELPAALIASIIQAVRAMVREDAKGLSNEMAAALFSELRGLTASEVARLEAAQE